MKRKRNENCVTITSFKNKRRDVYFPHIRWLLACGDPLGMENHEIPDYHLLSTTPHYDAKEARFNKNSAFVLQPQVDEYVQVDLGPGGKTLTAVAIHGRRGSHKDWVTKFALNYSKDGCEFFSYMENGVAKVSTVKFRNILRLVCSTSLTCGRIFGEGLYTRDFFRLAICDFVFFSNRIL